MTFGTSPGIAATTLFRHCPIHHSRFKDLLQQEAHRLGIQRFISFEVHVDEETHGFHKGSTPYSYPCLYPRYKLCLKITKHEVASYFSRLSCKVLTSAFVMLRCVFLLLLPWVTQKAKFLLFILLIVQQ